MGLIENEILELRSLLDKYKIKREPIESVMVQVSIYSQIEKRLRMYLAAKAMIARFGGGVAEDIKNSQIIGCTPMIPAPLYKNKQANGPKKSGS